MRLNQCLLAIAPCLLLLPACEESPKQAGSGDDGGGPTAGAANQDAEAGKLLSASGSTAEARDWLAADPKKHVLWKGDRASIARLVDDLYEAGATKVSAVEISKESTFELAATFVCTLPIEREARRKLFEVHNRFWKSYLSDDDPEDVNEFLRFDQGQKYLVFDFDL